MWKRREKMGEEDGQMVKPKRFEPLLRVVPILLSVAALAIMLKNKQSNEYGAIDYGSVAGFKYLVYANGICAGYSALSALDSAFFRYYSLCRAWIIFILDQALTYVMLSAGAVATEILYLAYKGNEESGWGKVCVSYGKLCSKSSTSLVITMVAVVCFILLSLLSAHRLFSKYEPPVPTA